MGLGAILLASGLALSSLASMPWHYYLSFGLLAGSGLSLAGSVSFTRLISNWFVKRRGLALSFIYAGLNSSFALYPAAALLLERTGWRSTFLIEAALVVGLLLPFLALLLRSRPEDKGLLPYGNEVKPSEMLTKRKHYEVSGASRNDDWTVRKALKNFRFWALCFTAFASWGIGQQIMLAHHIAFAEDMGYSRIYASSILAFFGMFVPIGALASLISDRIGREITFSIASIIGTIGLVILILMKDSSQTWMLYAYSILFGLGVGINSSTLAAASTDLFHGKKAGTMIGFVWFAFSVGGTIGPWLGGFIFEVSGSYFPAFVLAASSFLIASISLWIAAPRHAMKAPGT